MYCKALILVAVAGLAGCDTSAPSAAGLQVPTPAADALSANADVARPAPPDDTERAKRHEAEKRHEADKRHEAELRAVSAKADGLKEALDRANAKLDDLKETADRKHAALGDRVARLEAERDRRPPPPPDDGAAPTVTVLYVEAPPVYAVTPCVVVQPRRFSRWRGR